MTELSTNGARPHVAGSLGMSWSGHPAEGAYVFWALGTYVLSGAALKAVDHGEGGWSRVGVVNGVISGASSHNHFQSSGEHNTS